MRSYTRTLPGRSRPTCPTGPYCIHVFILFRGSLEYGLAQLLASAPQLSSLSVTECNLMITERYAIIDNTISHTPPYCLCRLLWLCSVHSPQLKQFMYTSDEFPPSPAALWALSNGCLQLQSLHLPPYLGR